jgi:hypothetical protein
VHTRTTGSSRSRLPPSVVRVLSFDQHLHPDWTEWTTDEARALGTRFGLMSATWALPATEE